MGDLRLSRLWDREIEGDLPDCRVRYSAREPVMFRRIPMEKVYCANCGTESGYATVFTPHVFFVCDKCCGIAGDPPGTVKVRG